MSEDGNHDDEIDLAIRFRGLSIAITGPADSAHQLVSDIIALPSRTASSTPSSTTGGAAGTPIEGESRAAIAASFPHCPQRFLHLASRLSRAPSYSAEERIERAWVAGCWAGAVLRGRVGSPNRTPQLSLQPRVYVVLRAEGLSEPAVYQSSASYWQALGGSHGSAISHSFASETEAKVYCAAAGKEYPTVQP